MSFQSLLNGSCVIQKRTLTQGKVDTEGWADGRTVPCRVLKQAVSPRSTNNTQRSTVIRTRFALPHDADIEVRDRLRHGTRVYDVIEVTVTTDVTGTPFHTVAVCEGVN